MTYFGFLLRFLVIPILILLFINLRDRRDSPYNGSSMKIAYGIFIHVILAVVYTTPWDNYLVASGVWYYKRQLVSGLIWGYVPVEEYAFFMLDTILAGLWWWFVANRLAQPGEFKPSKKTRFTPFFLLIIIWAIFVFMFFSQAKSVTYISIILVWALPAILLQFLFGADILWYHRKLLVLAILPAFLYFSIIDSLAISSGIWTIDPAQSTSIMLGPLPIEEAVFFLVTSALISFGVTLLTAKESPIRVGRVRKAAGHSAAIFEKD